MECSYCGETIDNCRPKQSIHEKCSKKKSRFKNREKRNKANAEYYLIHKERIKKRDKEKEEHLKLVKRNYYMKNEIKIKEDVKKRYKDNKEKIKEYNKQYRIRERTKIKETREAHYKKNKEKILAKQREKYIERKEHILAVTKLYAQKNREKVSASKRLTTYGITNDDYLRLLNKSEGKCYICNSILKTPNIDHCHRTGRIRGLLCRKCNTGLGFFEDSINNLESAITYLKISEQLGDMRQFA